jgi:hypothetical protein
VAYDVDRRPGAWVAWKAARHSRAVWIAVILVAVVAVGALALALSGHATIIGGLAVFVAIGLLKLVGDRQVDLAVRFRRGAAAERSVGETLNQLRGGGFIVMHDVEQAGEGNIDHIVSGPTGVFMIETKSRRYENKDLRKARRQAAKLHDELGVWVTPVICLHRRAGDPFRHDRVWILPQPVILDWIRAQRQPPAPFERLAHYADDL